jgi:hypothetical protein
MSTYNRDAFSGDEGPNSDYEMRERAAGHREQPERPDTSLHAQVCAALREPDRTPTISLQQPPTPIIRAPQELPEEHDANTASRMSVAQLRDRIQGMEATTRMKASAEIAQGRRPEKPSEKRARAAKLTAYRAELATREAREASDAERARLDTAAAATLQTATAELASPQPARVDPADVPTLVVCGRCGLLIAQDAEGDMIAHLDREQNACPARPTDWAPHRSKREPTAQAVDTDAASRARIEAYKADLRTAKAESAARDTRDAAQRAAETIARDKATLAATSGRRQQPTAQAPGLSDLDRAVEQLVRQHTSGAVIDAAWAASARIFRPHGGAR